MNKTKVTLFVILSLSLTLVYWIVEPSDINPLKEAPVSFAHSINNLTCSKRSESLKSKSDSIVNNAVLLKDFMSVSTATYSKTCGTYISSAGYAHKGAKIKPNKNTQFRIASISKPMTAVAIMQLYEQGKIDLDVPIQEYLPQYPISPKGDITVRQLLKHTSGIPHYTSTWDGISFTHYSNNVEAIDEFKHRPLIFSPGSAYEYTTYGYTVLGAIIEKVTNKAYQAYMQENIWTPANMTNTTIEEYDKTYENKAGLYIKWGNTFIKSPKTDLSVKAPGGGIISTSEDLIKFGKSLLNYSLIDSSSLLLMVNSTDSLKQGVPYGFGWFVREDDRYGKILEHGGSQSGASSFFRIYLDQQVATAAIANNFNSDNEMYYLTRDLTELLLDSFKVDAPVNYYAPQSDATLQRYVGTYSYDGQVLSISKEGQQLYAQTNPYPKAAIFSKSKEAFFYRIFDGQLRFITYQDETTSVRFTGRTDSKLYQKI